MFLVESNLRRVALHSMDHQGSVEGTISCGDHTMQLNSYWENCGVEGEVVTCTCGLQTEFFSGNGCWQQGHNGPRRDLELDLVHSLLYQLAQARTPDLETW